MKFKLIENYIHATNTHDFDNLVPLISDTATYQFTDKTCVGLKEIREYFENAWDIIKEEKYYATDITCLVQNEEVKVYIYNYHYEGFHNGSFTSGGGKATNVFQLLNDEWKLVLEHLN
ncbi:DUF4440 domain-containing protein [Erysipelotrichaceae bacterium MTC7]|nr:DUF4440 domain-containing protein [Erysipelotrichaceae bacterium MTC7]